MKTIAIPAGHPLAARGITSVKLGRKRPSIEKLAKVPKLRDYMRLCPRCGEPQIPAPPATIDWSAAAMSCLREVMGNDQYGDCTCAGAGHLLGVWTGNAGSLVTLTTEQVLAIYSAVTGFNPADPSTDQGADEVDVLNYLVSTGFPTGQKLAGFCAVDATNKIECMQAAWLAESLYFGLELPDAWISPFPSADGFVWDVGTPDPDNGHCVVAVGANAQGVQIDSWGLLGTITWPAVAALASPQGGGQLYALFSEDSIAKASGLAPNGFDWAQLQADFAAMQTESRGGVAA